MVSGTFHLPRQKRNTLPGLDARVVDAPSHVRNELACLSEALTYGVENGHVATNVAMNVTHPSKRVRQRLIVDAEYSKVYAIAGASVRLATALVVHTIKLNANVFGYEPRNPIRNPDGIPALGFAHGKSQVQIEVEIVGELSGEPVTTSDVRSHL